MNTISDTDALRTTAADLRDLIPVEDADRFDQVIGLAIRGLRDLHADQRGHARRFGTPAQREAQYEAWQTALDLRYLDPDRITAWSYRHACEVIGLASTPSVGGSTVRRHTRNPARRPH